MKQLFLTLLLAGFLAGSSMDFKFYKKEGALPGGTVLIIGGIQGDEPGGFNAASLLATRYRVTGGNLWVVPNLNFESIIKRSRGVYGDMNRKFAVLPQNDPEYATVEKIKGIITDPKVEMILNLHDGSGFFRPTDEDRLHNTYRWGQSCIIDQERINNARFGDLAAIAGKVVEEVNRKSVDEEHIFRLKNTKTREGDHEMEKSLTYFAINQGKPAFGIEATKEFPTHLRVYYHLLAVEGYLKEAGVAFTRDFEMTPEGVKEAINSDIRVSFYNDRISFDISDVRSTLNYFPLRKGGEVEFSSDNPLVALLGSGKRFNIHYGNRRMTFLNPQYMDFDDSIAGVEMDVDGFSEQVPFGRVMPVADSFTVKAKPGYRVNVIGFVKPGVKNESGVEVTHNGFMRSFSVDNRGKVYRVEVYKGDKFSGMILVDFDKTKAQERIARLSREKSLVAVR